MAVLMHLPVNNVCKVRLRILPLSLVVSIDFFIEMKRNVLQRNIVSISDLDNCSDLLFHFHKFKLYKPFSIHFNVGNRYYFIANDVTR